MTEPIRKRKAQEQLSPYSREPASDDTYEDMEQGKHTKPPRKASVRKNQPVDKSSLKGVFKNVVLAEEPREPRGTEMEEMVAGLNSSFVRAVQMVLEKQSNKDIRYLFDQYDKFMKDIEDNNQ